MSQDELDAITRSTLVALANECNYSTNAHVPERDILRNFKKHLRGDASKALKSLVRNKLAQKHPTGRNMTYNITQLGLTRAQE